MAFIEDSTDEEEMVAALAEAIRKQTDQDILDLIYELAKEETK